jgi:ABC-type bacteriocin/lantibiotic exporter with double-glycine peptidase domain
MLTAVDKIAHVTDLPLEPSGGIDIPIAQLKKDGLSVSVKNLSYKYPGNKKPSIQGISLSIKAGETVCIAGDGSSGKTTLTNVLAGIHTEYEGIITFNRYNLKDLDRTFLRDRIGKNVSRDDIFEGTILENILLGKPFADIEVAIDSLEKVGLLDEIYKLEHGFDTPMMSAGKGYSSSFINKLILARCLAKRPELLILNDFFGDFPKYERLKLIQMLTNPDNHWTLIVVSNDPQVMTAVNRIIYLEDGNVIADDTFENIIKNEQIVKNIY